MNDKGFDTSPRIFATCKGLWGEHNTPLVEPVTKP